MYSKADKQKGVGPSRKQKGGGISIARTYEADADRAGPDGGGRVTVVRGRARVYAVAGLLTG